MLQRKWIFISILSTFLYAENNETNATEETGIFESISRFFGSGVTDDNTSKENNISIDTNINKSVSMKNTKNFKYKENNISASAIHRGIDKSITIDTKYLRHTKYKQTKLTSNVQDNIPAKIPSDMQEFNGAWHLRVLDDMEVRKARAILDFTFTQNKAEFSGFDGCNRISGVIQQTNPTNLSTPFIMSTKMACRDNIHRWVSARLHKALTESFTIEEENKYGIEGIKLKSPSHELFFKKMKKD